MPVKGSVLEDPLLASPAAIVAVGAGVSGVVPGVDDAAGVLPAAGAVGVAAGEVVAGLVAGGAACWVGVLAAVVVLPKGSVYC